MSFLCRFDTDKITYETSQMTQALKEVQTRLEDLAEQIKGLATTSNETHQEMVTTENSLSAINADVQQIVKSLKLEGDMGRILVLIKDLLTTLEGDFTRLRNSLPGGGGLGTPLRPTPAAPLPPDWEGILGQHLQAMRQDQKQFEEEMRRRIEARDNDELEGVPPLKDEAPFQVWLHKTIEEWDKLGPLHGHAKLFSEQLRRQLEELCQVATQIEARGTEYWTQPDTLDMLDRTLFYPKLSVSWAEVGLHKGTGEQRNASKTQRDRLRVLETAVLNLRARVITKLRNRHQVAPLEVVPFETRFDATQHETTEFYTRRVNDPAKHNLIIEVERAGYGKWAALELAPQVLRRAQVCRYVHEPNVHEPSVSFGNGVYFQEASYQSTHQGPDNLVTAPSQPETAQMDEEAQVPKVAEAPDTGVPVSGVSLHDSQNDGSQEHDSQDATSRETETSQNMDATRKPYSFENTGLASNGDAASSDPLKM